MEILFRGKRVDGEWVEGIPVESVNGRTYMIVKATEDAINTMNEVDFVYAEVIPESIGQYIRNDKTGRKIFTGDVYARIDDETEEEIERIVVKIPEVYFEAWIYFGKHLGNTTDNPEVLEGV